MYHECTKLLLTYHSSHFDDIKTLCFFSLSPMQLFHQGSSRVLCCVHWSSLPPGGDECRHVHMHHIRTTPSCLLQAKAASQGLKQWLQVIKHGRKLCDSLEAVVYLMPLWTDLAVWCPHYNYNCFFYLFNSLCCLHFASRVLRIRISVHPEQRCSANLQVHLLQKSRGLHNVRFSGTKGQQLFNKIVQSSDKRPL